MKNTIKYLLCIAIAGFCFLKVYCKKDSGAELPPQKQTGQQMPQIPNGDFEDWREWWGRELIGWKTNSDPKSFQYWRYFVKQDTIAYHGKYSVHLDYIQTQPWISNKFPMSVHPSNLHAFVKCTMHFDDEVSINIDLLKKGIVVDSGYWVGKKTINEWTEITIPISKTKSVIDSALITIKGGTGMWEKTMTKRTEFWVDNMFFK